MSTELEDTLARISSLEEDDLAIVEAAVERRRSQLQSQSESPRASDVVEYRPHEDGYLQAEVRYYYKKDGQITTHGPYWYFRYHAQGRQRMLYLGKTDNPEAELASRRGAGPPDY